MAYTHYDRLTALDTAFLDLEGPSVHMHVGSVGIFERGPLAADGGIDFERILAIAESDLRRAPRFRQKLARVPVSGHPVWVDDEHFNLAYHVRHTALPVPGDERTLKRLTGRIMSQKLDREKPLWELWVIEGLGGDRVAVHSKVHHCMVDGVSGAELISALLTSEPVEKADAPAVWTARPAPGRLELALGEVSRLGRAPLRLGEALLDLARDREDARHHLAERLRATGRLLSEGLAGTTPAPWNRPVGPYRRVDWLALPLERIRAVRRVTEATVNDVVLATAAGAIGRFLARQRGVDTEGQHFRVMAPVSVRRPEEQEDLGNRVSAWSVDLPIGERDPLAQLAAIHARTEELKASHQALGADTLTQVTEWTGSGLLSLGSRLMTYGTPFNMVITNVPGPQVPLYMLESRLLEIHPHVPLMGTLGLGIALFSYAGTLSWGFSADWDLVPDLHDLVLETERAFAALCEAAGA